MFKLLKNGIKSTKFRMNVLLKKKDELSQLTAERKRHCRARQLAVFELNRVKTTVRKLRLGTIPSGDDQRWLTKVLSNIFLTRNRFKVPGSHDLVVGWKISQQIKRTDCLQNVSIRERNQINGSTVTVGWVHWGNFSVN